MNIKSTQLSVVYLVVAALSALEVMHSLPRGLLVTAGDVAIPELNPDMALQHLLATWNDSASFGSDSSFFRPSVFPWVLSEVVLAKLHFSAVAINHFWLYAIVMLQALLTLRLVLRLFPRITFMPALVFAAVANVLNPYMLIEMHSSYLSSLISVAAFPGVLAASLAFLEEGSVFALLEMLLWSGFCAGALNLGILAVEFPIFGLTLLCASFRLPRGRRSVVRPLQLMLMFSGVELFFALPSYHWLHGEASRVVTKSSTEYSFDTLLATSQFSPLKDAFRLVGQYLFFNSVGDKPFVAEGKRYVSDWWLIVASCGLPLLAVSSTIFFRGYGKRVLLVLSVTLLALFLGKGLAPPGRGIFEWLFFHFPLFQAFRNSFDKFGWVIALGYAVLSAVTLDAMWLKWGRFFRWSGVALAFLALFATAYPILGGGLFWPKAFISVPNYYFKLGRWLDNTTGRSVRIPISPTGFDTHDWGYIGSGILSNISSAPVLSRAFDTASTSSRLLNDISQDYTGTVGDRQFAGLLGLYGIRSVVYDPTIDQQFLGDIFSERMVEPVPQLRLRMRFGPVRVYQVNDELLNPEVYSPGQLITGVQQPIEFAQVCRALRSCRSTAFYSRKALADSGLPFETATTHVAKGSDQASPPALYWARPAIMESPEAPVATPKPYAGKFVRYEDFANTTISSNFRDRPKTLLTYGGHPPVVFTVSALGNADFKTIFTQSGAICADKASVQSHDVELPLKQAYGQITVMALHYRGHGVVPSFMIYDPNVVGHQFFLTVRPENQGTFLRAFRFPGAGKHLTARIIIRASQGGCLNWSLLVAKKTRQFDWRLLGNDSDFHATPPYFAANPQLLGQALDRLQPVLRPLEQTPGLPSQSAVWNDPALVAFQKHNLPWAIAARKISKDALLLRTFNSNAALNADFERLLPSAAYELKFPLYHLYGRPVHAVLYSQNTALGTFDFPEGRRNAVFRFRLPANATDLTVTIYSPRDAEYTANIIGLPSLTLLSDAANLLRITKLKSAPTPQGISWRWIDRATMRVTIKGAPTSFMLVYNGSFSPDWRLSVPKGVTQQHLHANAFANGWLLKGPPRGHYDVLVHYQNEEYSRDGAIAGSLFILLALSLCAPSRRREA